MIQRRLSINWSLVEQRRITAGLTRAELADRLGPGGGTLAYLWPSRALHPDDAQNTRLDILEQMCQILDLHPLELFTAPISAAQRRRMPPARAEHAADAAVLEVALTTLVDPVGHGRLATALGWTLERLHAALTALEQRLDGTGMRLDHDPGPPATIRRLRPRDALLTDVQRDALHRLLDLDAGLDPRDAHLLYEIALCGAAPTETGSSDPLAVMKLQRQGYLRRQHHSERLAASDDLAFSLLLDEA